MSVFTRSVVIGNEPGGDDGDLSSLVASVRSRRPAALDRLVVRVYARVRFWAARFTGDLDAADDVAQDVLSDLERRITQYDGRSAFSTWLFSVTRNVALNNRRREERRAMLLASRAHHEGTPSARADLDAVQLSKLALSYFDALPPKQKLVFELVDIRGMTPAEVARALRMEQATVRAHLFKARRAIRGKLLENHARLLEEYRS
jgi:RNA polymerase sigma-70 factor (ECF subfamily)